MRRYRTVFHCQGRPERPCRSALFRALLLAAALIAFSGRTMALAAFGHGEIFTYQVAWGIFSNAGNIVVAAEKEETEGGSLMRITVDTQTSGMVGNFFPLETRSVALLDGATGRILRYRETGFDGRRGVDKETSFDYGARQAFFVDRVRPERNRTIEFPEGENPTDLILGLIQTRRWGLQLGEERDTVVYASRDIYPVTVQAEDYQEIDTPLGNFRALLLVPRMRGEPRGIFEDGDEFRVWISEGDEPLPVQMKIRLEFGVVTLVLVGHTSGGVATIEE
jgi:hypothetical protein